MPDRRPPPVRLDLATAAKNRPPRKPKSPKRPRARKPRGPGNDSSLLYWIAGGLIVMLITLVALNWEAPLIKGWFANPETGTTTPPENLLPLPQKPAEKAPAPPQLTEEQQRFLKLKEKAAEETRLLQERTAVPPLVQPKPTSLAVKPATPVTPPPAAANAEPPLVQPVPLSAVPGAPARALPLDLNKLDTERIAAYQVALERIHFSCGFVDGDQGMRTQRMLRAFQTSRGLPVTGFLDQPTRDAIGEPGEPFLSYIVTTDDVGSIMPKPQTWREKAKATRLGYNDIWELLAEKFHCTRAYLKALNPTVVTPVAGTEIIGPKVYPAAPIPKAASLRISLTDTSIEALDASGKIIAFFPCSIAKDKNKRPHGELTVKVVDPHPDYTFDPALFADASKEEGITHKMTIPPGPRNPVGTTWVGLSLPGYGIHGTPEPENISRTQSHGCFRLANWNAEKVLKMVRVGTPVDVEQ
jgi:lipoprotein-anchoring transpeptidase ErfK/SrfK